MMGSAADVALLPSLHQSAAAGILEIKILYISYGPPTIDGALGHAGSLARLGLAPPSGEARSL